MRGTTLVQDRKSGTRSYKLLALSPRVKPGSLGTIIAAVMSGATKSRVVFVLPIISSAHGMAFSRMNTEIRWYAKYRNSPQLVRTVSVPLTAIKRQSDF